MVAAAVKTHAAFRFGLRGRPQVVRGCPRLAPRAPSCALPNVHVWNPCCNQVRASRTFHWS